MLERLWIKTKWLSEQTTHTWNTGEFSLTPKGNQSRFSNSSHSPNCILTEFDVGKHNKRHRKKRRSYLKLNVFNTQICSLENVSGFLYAVKDLKLCEILELKINKLNFRFGHRKKFSPNHHGIKISKKVGYHRFVGIIGLLYDKKIATEDCEIWQLYET